jgi:tetratricopeptide (TPR) repeat protein
MTDKSTNPSPQKEQALALLQSNRLAEAKDLYAQICNADPKEADAWYMHGMVNGMLGLIDDAGACFRQAIANRRDFADAHCNLGNVLLHQGKTEEALECYRQALRINPGHAGAHCNLGNLLQKMGRLDEAQASYRKALSLNSDLTIAHYNLGNLLSQQLKFGEAQECYRQALRINPGYVEAHNNLGNVLKHQGWLDEALACYRRALHINPDYIDGYINVGIVLELQGKFDAAMDSYRQTQRLKPGHIKAIAGEASVLARQHKFEAAYERLRPCLDAGTDDASIAITLATFCRHIGRCDEVIALIERLLGQDEQPLDRNELVNLHFALGKLYDDIGAFDDAFAHYRQGNALKPHSHDRQEHTRYVDALIQFYNRDFLRTAPYATIESQRPIFIVGMPRSGTSLVEQILASHPQVHGAGELEDIGRLTIDLPTELGVNEAYPQCLTSLTREKCNELARRYLDRLASLSRNALRVTDKMPRNFLHLGLIALLFPQARVIHCIRNPLDTCLSCYFQSFVGGNEFADDLADLGAYYNQYLRLMRHWKTTLDISILEMRYEELVTDQEMMSRRLVEYCGLDWDDRCLRFFENKRTVTTASYEQVRQPMYNKSVDRWKNYENHLGPLKNVLAEWGSVRTDPS